MRKILRHGVNPVFEALAYLTLKVNGRSIKKRFDNLALLHSDRAEALYKLAAPALYIEQELDKLIDCSDPVYEKFFRCSEWPAQVVVYFGNLASMYLSVLLHDDITLDLAGLEKKLLSMDDCDRLLTFALYQSPNRAGYLVDIDTLADYARFLDELELPPERKWECVENYLHYDENVKELTPLMAQAVEAFEKVTAGMEPPSFGLEEDTDEAFAAAARHYCTVELDMEAEFAALGSYMLLDGQTYAVLKHLPDEEHKEPWIQTTMYVGFTRFESKKAEERNLSGESAAEALRTIADPTRMEILRVLTQREVYAKELCDMLHMSASAISKHIAKLTSAGLVECRVDSIRTYYSLNPDRVAEVMDSVKGMLLGDMTE